MDSGVVCDPEPRRPLLLLAAPRDRVAPCVNDSTASSPLTSLTAPPPSVQTCELDDGTVFHYQYTLPSRLYVNWEGTEIEAALPGHFIRLYPLNNHAYFAVDGKIYAASFTPQTGITVAHVRDQEEGELIYGILKEREDPFGPPEEDRKEELECDATAKYTTSSFYLFGYYNTTPKPGDDSSKVDLNEMLWAPEYREEPIHQSHLDKLHERLRGECVNGELVQRTTVNRRGHVSGSFLFLYDIEKRDKFIVQTESVDAFPVVRYAGGSFLVKSIRCNEYNFLPLHIPICDASRFWIQNEECKFDEAVDCQVDSFYSVFFGQFTDIRILGRGGFGCVYSAESLLNHRRYAIKQIPLKSRTYNYLQGKLKEALLQYKLAPVDKDRCGVMTLYTAWIEAMPKNDDEKYYAKLDELEKSGSVHPAILANFDNLLEMGDVHAVLYVQMELGIGTLRDWLNDATNNLRDLSIVTSIFTQIVMAVEDMHKKSNFHRDLKPCNIIFTNETTVKLCDLGISTERAYKEIEIDIERTHIGTANYMAPEQKYEYSSKVDIFALGLILVELLVPMSEEEAGKLFENYRANKPNTIFDTLDKTPEIQTLIDLASQMTKYDPGERPELKHLVLTHPLFEPYAEHRRMVDQDPRLTFYGCYRFTPDNPVLCPIAPSYNSNP